MPARLPESGQCGSRGHCRLHAVGCAAALLARPPPPARPLLLPAAPRSRARGVAPACAPSSASNAARALASMSLAATEVLLSSSRAGVHPPGGGRVSVVYLSIAHPPLRFAPVSHKKSFEPNPFSSQYARARTPGPRRARRPLRPPPAHCRHRTAPAPPFPAKFPRGPHCPLIPAPPRPRFGQQDCSLLTRAFPFAGCYPGWSVR